MHVASWVMFIVTFSVLVMATSTEKVESSRRTSKRTEADLFVELCVLASCMLALMISAVAEYQTPHVGGVVIIVLHSLVAIVFADWAIRDMRHLHHPLLRRR